MYFLVLIYLFNMLIDSFEELIILL